MRESRGLKYAHAFAAHLMALYPVNRILSANGRIWNIEEFLRSFDSFTAFFFFYVALKIPTVVVYGWKPIDVKLELKRVTPVPAFDQIVQISVAMEKVQAEVQRYDKTQRNKCRLSWYRKRKVT